MHEARWTARAWAPAHLTGFFEIRDEHANPYRKGSRGAGLNLDVGVEAEITIHTGASVRSVTVNGAIDEAPTIHRTLEGLLGDKYPASVEVGLTSPLPASQGFGVSGAGALATALALAHLLDFPAKKALWEAHRAEVLEQTGLGDVPGQFLGGAEIRVTAGPIPMGVTQRFAGLESRRVEVLCLALEEPLSTKRVLSDPDRRARINAAGAASVEALQAEPTLGRYMQLSAAFADRVGLITPALAGALAVARRHGPATQTMLGNSLHLILDPKSVPAPDVDAAMADLQPLGALFRTKISARGAHVIRDAPAEG